MGYLRDGIDLMGANQQMLIAEGLSKLSTSPLPGNATGTNASSNATPAAATASVIFGSNGVVTFTQSPAGSDPADHNWYSPTTAGVGSSYWVRGTQLSGNTPNGSSPTMGVWTQISSNVSFQAAASGALPFRNWHIQIDIASDSGGVNIVATSTGGTAGYYSADADSS